MVVMLDTPCTEVVWRALATQSISQFPFYFPSHASPCAITFQLDSTTVFYVLTNVTIFCGKKLLNIKCVFWCSVWSLSGKSHFVTRNDRDIITNVYRSSGKVPRYSCRVSIKLELSLHGFDNFFKYQISWKSVQWELSCSTRRDGRTDMKLMVRFFAILRTCLITAGEWKWNEYLRIMLMMRLYGAVPPLLFACERLGV